MTTNKIYLSATSIKTYLSCKKRFKYKYLNKIDIGKTISNKYISFGNSMHMALADYNMITDESYKTLDILHNLLRKNWIRDGYSSIKKEKEYGQMGLKLLNDLKYIKENKSYIVNEDEAENIRKIFKIYYENIDKVGKKDNNGKTFTKNSLVKLIKEEIKIDNRNISQNFIESIIKRPIYAKKLPIDSNIKLKDILYYDVKRNKYDLNEKDLIECTNINDAIIDIDFWKKIVVKALVKEIKGKRKAPEYLFKKLLYCGT
ncbi:PD-(D/E)XK nuclease family protein [Caloranaerobacter sp. DY30410]|uniref:PD-(D/E)XK nuclease family protein n=1 Tax=Caloranaerobacter sp. DY30410 TaxID=3238305 RepID=UPI003D00E080